MRQPAADMALQFLLPNLASMLAAATLIYCLFLYGAGEKLFRDSDTGWHIRNGESILANRALPHTDPYSFSKSGQPWVSWEWGSDVLMGLTHRFGGLRALTALFSLIISAASWLWCRLNFAMGGDFFLAGVFAPLMITTTSAHWLARPHVFSWIFLLGVLLFAEWGRQSCLQPAFSRLLLVAAASALWANLHASFF